MKILQDLTHFSVFPEIIKANAWKEIFGTNLFIMRNLSKPNKQTYNDLYIMVEEGISCPTKNPFECCHLERAHLLFISMAHLKQLDDFYHIYIIYIDFWICNSCWYHATLTCQKPFIESLNIFKMVATWEYSKDKKQTIYTFFTM